MFLELEHQEGLRCTVFHLPISVELGLPIKGSELGLVQQTDVSNAVSMTFRLTSGMYFVVNIVSHQPVKQDKTL